MEIERKLEEIDSRNSQRMEELREVERRVVRRIEEEFERK